MYQMMAKKAQEKTKDAKKLKMVQDQERWIDEMNKSLRTLGKKVRYILN